MVGRPAGEHPRPLIGQQEPDPGAVEVAPYLVGTGPAAPSEATVIYVTVVGHLEPFGTQPRTGATLPGGDNFAAQLTSLATRFL